MLLPDSRPPHIIHITTVPQTLAFIREQPRYMDCLGFTTIAISSPGKGLIEFSRSEGVGVYELEMTRKIAPWSDLRAISRLTRLLRQLAPTIIQSHTPKGGLIGMIAASIARVPVRIYEIHGLPYMTLTGSKRKLLMATERASCLFANRVFCVSHSIRAVVIADGICPADKIVVLANGSSNGVDATQRFDPKRFSVRARSKFRTDLKIGDGELVIGFVGRIVRDKGIEELSSAWTVLREEYPLLRLIIVGVIEPQDPVRPATLRTLRNDPRVIMTGSVNDTSTMYSIFDLLVLPSYREGLGNVLLEAAAMELAVVATRIPGCVDAVEDGMTGTLVPVRDIVALSDALRMYLDDPALRQRHGKAGRERVLRNFQQEVIWEATYKEYSRLLRKKGLPVPEPVPIPET